MAGNSAGGKLAYLKNIAKNPNFYAEIGAKGGKKGKTGGFASDKKGADGLTGRERAKLAGAAGGRISRRASKKASVTPITVLQDENLEMAA